MRVPAHPVAQALLARLRRTARGALGQPVRAASARPRAEHVLAGLAGRIAAVVDGGACAVGVESTIVGLDGRRRSCCAPAASRPRRSRLASGAAGGAAATRRGPNAPGQLASHYAPARAGAARRSDARARRLLARLRPGGPAADLNLSPAGDLVEAAANLFHYLREADVARRPARSPSRRSPTAGSAARSTTACAAPQRRGRTEADPKARPFRAQVLASRLPPSRQALGRARITRSGPSRHRRQGQRIDAQRLQRAAPISARSGRRRPDRARRHRSASRSAESRPPAAPAPSRHSQAPEATLAAPPLRYASRMSMRRGHAECGRRPSASSLRRRNRSNAARSRANVRPGHRNARGSARPVPVWRCRAAPASSVERQVRRRLVDDQAHRAIVRMRAEKDHAVLEAGIAHAGHRDQKLATEVHVGTSSCQDRPCRQKVQGPAATKLFVSGTVVTSIRRPTA